MLQKWRRFALANLWLGLVWVIGGMAQSALVTKVALPSSGLELSRRTQASTFYDVVGRKSAVFGYEHRAAEAWVYPMKLLDDFRLSFKIAGYPLEFTDQDTAVSINVRPEATTFTYAHAAFTVKQTIFAPVDEAGVIMLLDVNTTLPMTVNVSFRPKLKLFWPAGMMTANLDWQEKEHAYYIIEETNRYVGMIGSPVARDISLMPYQEEPRDVPNRFVIEAAPGQFQNNFIPIIIAGSIKGRADAKAIYNRLLTQATALYAQNVNYYKNLQDRTASVTTPEPRLNTAFAWAKVGIEKGLATNPALGTGLVAGFRTSGESERPGFAWFFGRDSMWTALALNAEGDYATTRTALEFLKQFQREDGKIPHEISQSAADIPWFTKYPYAWNSTDATPLYLIVHADYYRATGDTAFLQANWASLQKAYAHIAATDTDGNGLMENTKFGHGWVEGGALYPPHEEIYLQGVFMESARSYAELADAMQQTAAATNARAAAERTRVATEKVYWLQDKGFYAYATKKTTPEPPKAEPGPRREMRQARLNELQNATLYDENTVLPAVPLWWGWLQDDRAQQEIDRLGSGRIATDWGARIISNESRLYDPLSYHYGSVWPLFTGWQSMGAYRYGRPHVGYQALMATSLLTYTSALGYVTELLSGDFNAPFGRSSHHQVWSEAMVVTPTVRGLFGLEVMDGGRTVRFAPQLPADWNQAALQNIGVGANGATRLDFAVTRTAGRLTIKATRRAGDNASAVKFVLAPAFPLDAKLSSVTANGKPVKFESKTSGDVQRAEVTLDAPAGVVFNYAEGSDVYYRAPDLQAGATSNGLRIVRSRADNDALRLTLEGAGGQTYTLGLRTGATVGAVTGATLQANSGADAQLSVSFGGMAGQYTRQEVVVALKHSAK